MFNQRFLRSVKWVFLDVIVCLFSLITTSCLKFDFIIPESFKNEFSIYLIVFVAVYIFSNILSDCYHGVFKHSGVGEAMRQVFAAIIAAIILIFFRLFRIYNFSISIIIIYCLLSAFITAVSRFYSRFPCAVNTDDEVISGENPAQTLLDVNYEDILGRGAVTIQEDQIISYVRNKVVLVTGGAGSIGSEICRQILSFECKLLILIDFNENALFEIDNELAAKFSRSRFIVKLVSIRDQSRMSAVFQEYRPAVVFHAAAHKHVPMMELNVTEAIKNNIFGTLNVIKGSYEHRVQKLVLISSDKAVNAANIMGATKRVSEMMMQIYNGRGGTEMSCVRFGNVLDSNGSVLPIFKKQIMEGGPLTLTHKEITRYFMTIPEAVQLVLQASALSKGGEIFFLDMGEPVRIYDLACDLIKQAGLIPDKDIKIEVTGLRPGEKLYEELSYDYENVSKTNHEMIFVCDSDKPRERDLLRALTAFHNGLAHNDEKALREHLFKIVSGQYSAFEYTNKEPVKITNEILISAEA